MAGPLEAPSVEEQSLTLGAVLYPARTTAGSEEEWVMLVRSVAGGDPGALHALYARAHRLVFTLAVRITGSSQAAEQLTVEVFHDVWRGAAGYDATTGTVLAWIMNLARSRALGQARPDAASAPPRRGGDVCTAPAHSPGEPCLRCRSQSLRRALGALTPDERGAIEAVFFSGASDADAASRLDRPVVAVRSLLRSALHKLRLAQAAGEVP